MRVRNEAFTLAPVGLKAKEKVVGMLPVQALFTGVPPARVLLYLDGREIDHDTSPPYLFKWDTRRATDGLHLLTLAGRARDGRIVRSRIPVNVVNGSVLPAAIVGDSLVDGQTVSGTQHWLVETSGTVAVGRALRRRRDPRDADEGALRVGLAGERRDARPAPPLGARDGRQRGVRRAGAHRDGLELNVKPA